MKTYLSLLTFTEQGVRNLSQSPQRAAAFRQSAEAAGVKIVTQLWTTGAYDGVLVLQGENEETLLRVLTQLAAQGNVRTHTLRAFDAAEFGRVTAAK